MVKGERLIPLDETPPRGWLLIGEIPTDDGPRLHIIYWRRQKRIDHQMQQCDPRMLSAPRRAYEAFFGRHDQ